MKFIIPVVNISVEDFDSVTEDVSPTGVLSPVVDVGVPPPVATPASGVFPVIVAADSAIALLPS